MNEKKNNVVTYFMWYIYNKWNENECIHVFGEDLGAHIWSKWMNRMEALRWYADLDEKCRQMLVDRAIEIYKR